MKSTKGGRAKTESPLDLKTYQKQAKLTDQFKDDERSMASSFWNINETVGALSRLYDERDRRINKVNPERFKDRCSCKIGDILWYASNIAECMGLDLDDIARANLKRCQERWGEKDHGVTLFDEDYPEDERLPRQLTLKVFSTKRDGVAGLAERMEGGRWKPLGARVTDNSHTEDGYRYHDVLHLSYMAVLGWSPVMRSLLNLKRKSKPKIDEVEDGARAANLEEALTALIYEHARTTKYFEEEDYVPFDVLKWVERITRGLEVNRVTYDLWSKAILDGYRVFRLVMKNKGGFVQVDLNKRSIVYRKTLKGE